MFHVFSRLLLLSVLFSLNHCDDSNYQSQIRENALSQLLIIDNDKIDFENLKMLVNILSAANRDQVDDHVSYEKAVETDGVTLDDFLTLGRQPSTINSLGLSSMCDICASVLNVVGKLVPTKRIWPQFIQFAKNICPGVTGGFPQHVCDGFIDINEEILYDILPGVLNSPYTVCGNIFSNLGCGSPDHQHFLWELQLPENKDDIKINPKQEKKSDDKLGVLLVTDLHIDPKYAPGSPAQCKEPLCCRNSSTPIHEPLPESEKTRYWGEYSRCDTPVWAFHDLVREIKENLLDDVDFVFVAGDLTPHDVWNQTAEDHLDLVDLVGNTFKQELPGIPVFFACGNHEVVPLNAYNLENDQKYSNQWLYDKFADVWLQWLDEPTINNGTIRRFLVTTSRNLTH